MPILPTDRDPRLVTIRRGGTLTDEHHHQIARWAVDCAEHVLPIFERARPHDTRPRDALDVARAWIRGDVPMKTAHTTAFIANRTRSGSRRSASARTSRTRPRRRARFDDTGGTRAPCGDDVRSEGAVEQDPDPCWQEPVDPWITLTITAPIMYIMSSRGKEASPHASRGALVDSPSS
ncbi:putative immunity protein [Cellulosimicrobium sp. KWT-B]|uniref:putative immunity protein n=1 Tax=Cellulosimicrobium sp. KWT-B TaxID=1981152 RepID=UPI003514599A